MQSSSARECDPRLTRILMAQYKNLLADPHPNLLAWVDEADLRQWYFLVVGLEEPFAGGEYLFKLTAPDEFPHQPPKFEFLSQNGVYMPGGPICISVGEFHAEDTPGKEGSYGWRPSLGMKGFAREVVNGLIHFVLLDSGIRIIQTPDSLKKMYAKASAAYNKKHYARLAEAFEALCLARPDSEPVRNLQRGRALLAGAAPAARAPAARAAAPAAPAAPAPAAAAAAAAPEDDDSVALDFALALPGPAPAAAQAAAPRGGPPAPAAPRGPAPHGAELAPSDADMAALIDSLLAD